MDDEFLDPNDYYADQDENWSRDSATSSEAPQETLHRSVGWVAAAVLLFAIVWVYSYPEWFSSSNSESADLVSPVNIEIGDGSGGNIVADKIEEITGLSLPIPGKADWAKEEEIAANRAAVTSFKNSVESISTIANSNVEDLALLKSKTTELLTSEAGAKLGSKTKYLEQYIALEEQISEMEATIPVADGFANDMVALLERVEQAGDTKYSPQSFVVIRADDFVRQYSQKSVEIKRFSNAIDRLIAETDELVPGSPLVSALKSYQKNSDANFSEKLSQARKEAKDKGNQRLFQAEQEQIESEIENDVGKIQAQTKRNKQLKRDLLAKAAKQKLEREFNADIHDVNSYLLPFIADGGNMRGNATGKGPASWLAIKNSGGLENSAQGLSKLSKAANNGRPLGGFPVNIFDFMIINNTVSGNLYNSPKYRAIEAYLERAQSLLNKYGDLLVEKGMLAD